MIVLVVGAEAQYRGELAVDAVVVPVTVRNKSGRVVSNVRDAKFHIFVDGMEVPIRDIAREQELPLALGFVLDTSGSMAGGKMRSSQQLMMSFLEHRRKEDQIALWTFSNERVLERFPFGTAWYLLPRVLEGIKPWSTTALYDMVLRFPEVMELADHPRRAVILLSDGVDNASAIGPEEATEVARKMRTPVYVLGVEPPPPEAGKTGPSFEQVLEIIATSSGGHYRRVPRTEDMPGVVEELLNELSSRYILSFTTSGLGVRKWRTIRVQVEGYEVTTRKGYMGTLP
jgi:Ca-activated chloride channel family protein